MTTPEMKDVGPNPSDVLISEPGEPQKEIAQVHETPSTHTPGQVAAQVTTPIPAGQQGAQQTQSQVVTVTVPATPEQLADWSKGETEDSLTWAAFFWIRMIKKAISHGWRVLTQNQEIQYA